MQRTLRSAWNFVAVGLTGAAIAGVSVPVAAQVAPPGLQSTAVEYFNSAFGHYFVTSLPAEIAALDAGQFDQWSRTGWSFGVWNGGSGLDDVCRFFTTAFAPKSSHFYTPDAAECVKVKANPDWAYETIAFNTVRPGDDGACPAFATPLYRLYNEGQGGAPNHRYTTSLAVRSAMLDRRWTPEGNGAAGVIACVTPPASAPPAVVPVRVTGGNPLPTDCDAIAPSGTLFAGAEVEPHVAVDPTDPARLVGVWQQNRWSNGGAQALLAAVLGRRRSDVDREPGRVRALRRGHRRARVGPVGVDRRRRRRLSGGAGAERGVVHDRLDATRSSFPARSTAASPGRRRSPCAATAPTSSATRSRSPRTAPIRGSPT